MSIDFRKIREQKHLTQEELSEETGLSVRTIQRIEAGQEPKGYTAKALYKALEIEKQDLAKSDDVLNFRIVKMINLSALIFCYIPIVNIIIPLLITFRYKLFNKLTRQILSLQMLWAIVAVIFFFLLGFLKLTFSFSIRVTQFIMTLLIVLNFILILINASSLDRKGELRCKLNFSLI